MPCGYVYVDGSGVGEITEALLKDRRILRDEGFISIFVVVDSVTGKVAAGPRSRRAGSPRTTPSSTRSSRGSRRPSPRPRESGVKDAYQLQQVVRRVVGKWVGGKLRRRPMIIPVVIEA